MSYTRTDPWSPRLCAQESFPAPADIDSTLTCAPSELMRQRLELQAAEKAAICVAGYQRRKSFPERQALDVCMGTNRGSVAEKWAAETEARSPQSLASIACCRTENLRRNHESCRAECRCSEDSFETPEELYCKSKNHDLELGPNLKQSSKQNQTHSCKEKETSLTGPKSFNH